VTCASNQFPLSKVIDGVKEFITIKRLAVLYTPGEKNSEIQFKNLQAIQESHKIEVIPVSLSNKEEAAQIMPAVIHSADAIYMTGGNAVNSAITTIVDLATRARVATVTHLDDLVDKGVLFGICSNSYLLGRQAGAKAVKVLRGANPSSLPIDKARRYDYLLNMKTVKAGHP